MAGSYFNNPNKARSAMGRGRQVDYDLDDASGWLQQGVSGFKTKAKAGGETIFLPIFPGAIRTVDGEDTDYFRAVQVAEFGLERNFTSFIANPSDKPDLPYNEIPVIMLNREFDSGVKRNDPVFLPAARFFVPHGQYKQPDFRWPATWVVFQAAVYRQPSIGDPKVFETLKGKIRQLNDGPNGAPGTWVYIEPEFKTVWIKGTGRDAISAALHGVDDKGNFTLPLEAFAGGAPCAFRTIMYRDAEDKPNMGVDIIDLASNGLRAPTREEVIKRWVPWEKVFRKITYAEQVARCAKYFGNDLVGAVIPDLHTYIGAQHGGQQPPAGQQASWNSQPPQQPAGQPPAASWGGQQPPQQPQQPAQPPAASWGAPPAGAPSQQPAPASVRTFQPPAEQAQVPAQQPQQPAQPPAPGPATWGVPAAPPQQQVQQPQQPAGQATAPPPQQGTVQMTPAEMAARFGAYRKTDAAPQQPQ
jgi:hypothetical protein